MKVKNGFVVRRIADVYVVVPVMGACLDFNGIITFNETAAFLFGRLKEETTKEKLVCEMLNEYEINQETALRDIDTFFKQLQEANLLA